MFASRPLKLNWTLIVISLLCFLVDHRKANGETPEDNRPVEKINKRNAITLEKSGMTMDDLVDDVLPTVKRLLPADWTLDLSEVKIEVLSRKEYRKRENIQRNESRPKRTGLPRMFEIVTDIIGSATASAVVSQLDALYSSTDKTITVLKETVDRTDVRYLSALLAHEMVHVAQHQTFPKTFHEFTGADGKVQLMTANASTKEERHKARKELLASRLLLEGQAVQIQNDIMKTFPANLKEKFQPLRAIGGLILITLSSLLRQLAFTYSVGPTLNGKFDALWRSESLRKRILLPKATELINETSRRKTIRTIFRNMVEKRKDANKPTPSLRPRNKFKTARQ